MASKTEDTSIHTGDYPTTDLGRPDGKNRHYRVHMNDSRGMRKVAMALQLSDRLVYECDCCDFPYFGIETNDSKGHIPYLTEWSSDKRWESPFPHEDWEINYRNGGGVRIRGTFTACDEYGGEFACPLDSGMREFTMSEVREIANLEADPDDIDRFYEIMGYIKEDAVDEYHEKKAEAQRECDHRHTVEEDGPGIVSPDAAGYCEDCGAEVTAEGELAW